MFIVLEGGDGTGKSTITELLAKELDGVAYSTPPKQYRKYRTEVDRTSTPEEHYKFYRESVIDASTEIQEMLKNNVTVVCDRYWLSTIAYHQAMGVKVDYSDFDRIIKPDLTVLLVTPIHEQIRRIIERGMSAGDKRMLEQQCEIRDRLFQNIVQTESHFICLDTGLFSIEKCIKIISAAVI